MENWIKLLTSLLAQLTQAAAAVVIGLAITKAAFSTIVSYFAKVNLEGLSTESIRLKLGKWLALALEFLLGVDPLSWTHSECVIWCPQCKATRRSNGLVEAFRKSSKRVQFDSFWKKERRSLRSRAISI